MNLFLVILSLLCNLLIGCSSIGTHVEEQDIKPANSGQIRAVEVYLYHSNVLGDPEFEHYKLQKNTLLVECGNKRHNKYITRIQDILDIDLAELAKVYTYGNKLLGISSKTASHLEKPSEGESVFDPGKVEIILEDESRSIAIATSISAVVNNKKRPYSDMFSFVRLIRSISGYRCGRSSFFGI